MRLLDGQLTLSGTDVAVHLGLNRLNVATTRAKCRPVLAPGPQLDRPDSRTVQQTRLANAVCASAEKAKSALHLDPQHEGVGLAEELDAIAGNARNLPDHSSHSSADSGAPGAQGPGPLAVRVLSHIPNAAGLYHRLILLAGPPRTGKTTALRELAAAQSWPMVNVNLALSERLLELTSRQRALRAPRLLEQLAVEREGEVILLDNTEILFSPELRQDPLRLLQGISRNRTVVASWAGTLDGESLTYAEPAHGEFRRYQSPDAVIVPTVDNQSGTSKTQSKEQA